MGGLKDKIPITYWTMFIGSVAIAGIPGLAGFFSKDEILWQAFSSPLAARSSVYVVGIVTAGMTAFYMWRLMYMTFYGKSRVDARTQAHVHESPRTMTVPLMVLAVGQRAGGLDRRAEAVEPVPRGLPRLRALAGAGVRASAAHAAAHGGRASRHLHRMDADGAVGGGRRGRHPGWRATST